jgi:hypothetical protein
MKLLQLSIYNYQLSMNEQFSFINVALWKTANGECMVNRKWLIVNGRARGIL